MRALAVALVASAACIAGSPAAWAQDVPSTTEPPPAPGSTTTTPPTSTTTPPTTTQPPPDSTLPPDPTAPVPEPVAPVEPAPVTVPPELVGDPRAPVLLDPSPHDGGEIPIGQGVFDPSLNQVLLAKVIEMSVKLEASKAVLAELQSQLAEKQVVVEDLTTRLESMTDQVQRNVVAAALAEQELKEHTVEAFITGHSDDKMALVRTSDPVQLGVAREMLGSVVDTDEEVIDRYRLARASISAEQARLASELEAARSDLLEIETLFSDTLADAAANAQALTAFQGGSQLYVRGFVFPIIGEVEFIDSWGYPRMSGTSQAHWHQGTDIFAPRGTPLIACESGTLERIGVASLGGNKLWVKGDSGNEYYYAHLEAFAPGIQAGMRVNAGQVVGYVGDTGNARGTSPHLHFEVHPGGGSAVNPYPLLKATYGTRAMVEVVVAPTDQQPGAPADPSAVLGLTTTTTTAVPPEPGIDTIIPGP